MTACAHLCENVRNRRLHTGVLWKHRIAHCARSLLENIQRSPVLVGGTLAVPSRLITCYVTPANMPDSLGARRLIGGLAFSVPRLKMDLGRRRLTR